MIYLLDTDTVIHLIRSLKKKRTSSAYRKASRLVRRVRKKQAEGDTVGISAITKAELEYGAAKSGDPAREQSAVYKILAPFEEFGFDSLHCPVHYGQIRAQLEGLGNPIGSMDLLIAAHALAIDATLVSNNTRHFTRVDGLKVQSWIS